LYYDFFYEPTKLRLSPPDGLGNLASNYFVNDRANSRRVNQRGVRCDPFRIVPGVPGNGLEEPASHWGQGSLGLGSVLAVSGSIGGHLRQGTRWPFYDWDIEPNLPDITLWDAIAQCVGFEPTRITVKMVIGWILRVDLFQGHVNNYGALWGTFEAKTDVTTNWTIEIKANIYDIDETAVRAMLAGDIGGRTLWTRSVSQTIPGSAELNGNNGGGGVQWLGLIDNSGSQGITELDVSTELQNTNMKNQLFWIGPKIDPPFGEPTGHYGIVRFFPPASNPPFTDYPYNLGYVKNGHVTASIVSANPPPGGPVVIGDLYVYR
jgi:hypothetical protein